MNTAKCIPIHTQNQKVSEKTRPLKRKVFLVSKIFVYKQHISGVLKADTITYC